MASNIERIRRIEAARAEAAEKAQARGALDPTGKAVRLLTLYAAAAGRTDLQSTRRMRAHRVRDLIDLAADRAGRPRLSAAVPAPLRIVNTSTTTPPAGPTPPRPTSAGELNAQLQRQAQRRDTADFVRLPSITNH